MNVHISENAARFVRAQVQRGRYASENEVIEEALYLLKQREREPSAKQPRTEEEFQRHLVEIGLMSQFPVTGTDIDDPGDQPIDVEGEPLSATVIRERR